MEAEAMALFEMARGLIETLVPFLVAAVTGWFAYLGHQTDKRNKEKEKAEEEAQKRAEKRDADLISMISAVNDGLQTMKIDIDGINETIQSMHHIDDETNTALHTLRVYHEKSARQSHQLAHLVMTLAEGLRDQHLDGALTQAVADYRNFEARQLEDLMADVERVNLKK